MIGRPSGRPADRVALVALLVFVTVLFPAVVFRGEVFSDRDLTSVQMGVAWGFRQVAGAGSWPLWNPYLGFGEPLLGDPNYQVFHPFTWLSLVLPPWRSYALYVVTHVVFGAFGVYRLGSALGLAAPGALLSAALWAGAGPTRSLVDQWNHFGGQVVLPWAVLWGREAVLTGRPRAVVLCGAAFAAEVFLASVESVLMSAVLLGALVVWDALRPAALRPPRQRMAAALAAAALFALGLAAVQWAPALEQALGSVRRTISETQRLTWSLHPLAGLLEVTWPLRLDLLPLTAEARAAAFSSREPLVTSVHLGVPFLFLALSGLVGRAPAAGALGLTAATSLLYALGRHTPVYALAVAAFPPLQALRYPSKTMTLFALAMALLAGGGFEAWRSHGLGRRARVVATGATLVLALATGAVVLSDNAFWRWALGAAADAAAPARVGVTVAAALAFLVLGLALAAGPRASGRVVAGAAALAAIGQLVVAHRDVNGTAPEAVLAARPPTVDAVRALAPQRLYVYHYGFAGPRAPRDGWTLREDPVRQVGRRHAEILAMRAALLPYLHPVWPLEGSYDVSVLSLGSRELRRANERLRGLEGTPGHTAMLRAGGVSHVVALHREGLEDLAPVAVLGGPFTRPLRVLAVPDPLPRASVVHGVRLAEDALEAVDALGDPAFDPRRVVVLLRGSGLAAAEPAPPRPAVVLERRPDRVVVEATVERPGVLVMPDAYDAGWRATVDGQPADLLRANGLFRGVALGPGRHRVELRYRPATVLWGGVVSGAFALAGLAAALRPDRAGSP